MPTATKPLKTELGLKILVAPAQKEAERVAAVQEELEERKERLKRALADLLAAMRKGSLNRLSARAPGGTPYVFVVKATDVKVQISKAKQG